MSKIPLYLQIVDGEGNSRREKFELAPSDNIIIGKGPAAHLKLEDSKVARIHAMIKLTTQGQFILSDLGWSDEGTFLNDQKIESEMPLTNGDKIKVGETVLQIFFQEVEEEAPAPQQEATPPAGDVFSELFGGETAQKDESNLEVNPLDLLSGGGESSQQGSEDNIFPEATEVMSEPPPSIFKDLESESPDLSSTIGYDLGAESPDLSSTVGYASNISFEDEVLSSPPEELNEESAPQTPENLQKPEELPDEQTAQISVEHQDIPSHPAEEVQPEEPVPADNLEPEEISPAPVPEEPLNVEHHNLQEEDRGEVSESFHSQEENVEREVAEAPPEEPKPQPQVEQQQPAQAQAVELKPIPEEELPPLIKKGMITDDPSRMALQVKFVWNGTIVDIGHFEKPRVVTVGEHPLNDFNFADPAFPQNVNFPLVVPAEGGGFGIFFTDRFTGYIEKKDGSRQSFEEIKNSLISKVINNIPGYIYTFADENEKVVLKGEEIEIEFSYVPLPQKVYIFQREVDYLFWRVTGASFIFHLALLLLFQFIPKGTSALSAQLLKGRFAKLVAVPPPEKPKHTKTKFEIKKKKKEEPKKIVTDQKVSKNVKYQDDGPMDQRARDMQRVKRSGILGLLSQGFGDIGPGGNIFGKATGQQFLGKVLGTTGGSAGFGMGLAGRGFGFGGGGGGGMYGGGAFGYGGRKRVYGRGGMNLRTGGRKKRIVRIVPGRLILKGALSKEEIARVVKANWYQIKYCYESQLRHNPKLSGKIVVQWIIAGNGFVQSAVVISSTMNNSRVENCITRRILRWKFPQPQGGGIVRVKYPFVFQTGG